MSDLIAALSKVHDNFILSYAVDFQEHTLKLKTQKADGHQILLTFAGLLAHHFEHVSQDNILLALMKLAQKISLLTTKDYQIKLYAMAFHVAAVLLSYIQECIQST